MRTPDPIIIGIPAHGFPIIYGFMDNPIPYIGENFLIGQTVKVHSWFLIEPIELTLNVSYVPNNPRRERLLPILQPKSIIPATLWELSAFRKAEAEQMPTKPQEEYPF